MPFSFLVSFALSRKLIIAAVADGKRELESLKGNDKYNIIRKNSTNLWELTLTYGFLGNACRGRRRPRGEELERGAIFSLISFDGVCFITSL